MPTDSETVAASRTLAPAKSPPSPRRWLCPVVLVFALLVAPGCSPRFFQAALLAAAVIGTVAVLAHHDAHFHDDYCGHERVWQDGRWIYHYHQRWEYYDPATGSWYYYAN